LHELQSLFWAACPFDFSTDSSLSPSYLFSALYVIFRAFWSSVRSPLPLGRACETEADDKKTKTTTTATKRSLIMVVVSSRFGRV
jgi:hypothetical protein